MTMEVNIGKFKTEIKHQTGFGYRKREVEFDVSWISCGTYQMSYRRPFDATPEYVLVTNDWYPADTFSSFTPEQFEKVAELFPSAPHPKRNEAYKPFYENFTTDMGMIDLGYDCLFQAFKDQKVETVYLVNQSFVRGVPATSTSVLGLEWKDFLRLKELIDNKKNETFYSGCKISSGGEMQAVWVGNEEDAKKAQA